MIKKRKILVWAIAAIFIATLPGILYSQALDSTRYKVEKAIYKVVIDNVHPRQCKDVNFSLGSMVILFSKRGEVKSVTFSQLPGCLLSVQAKLSEDLKASFKKLQLSKKVFSECYILSALSIRSLDQFQNHKAASENAFKEIDESQLVDKKLKYLFSIDVCIYPTITN